MRLRKTAIEKKKEFKKISCWKIHWNRDPGIFL